jgi:predicted ATPase/DNA-binding SARP family transcriptional activator
MATFRLFLFGSPRLECDGVVVKISRRKALALLSYLAATDKPHARDSLATLFWPDYGQSEARVALSRHLSYLNKTLVADALVLETESVALADDFWLDMAEFAEVLAAHPTVTARDLPAVQAAIDLYQADFLAGFTLPDCPDFDDWQAFQSESLRQTLRAALEKVSLAQAALHDDENAIATARRRLALDSLDETAHRTLMQLYAQSGQQAAALRQYDQCRQMLADELGASPAAETTELVERIRRGELNREAKVQSKLSPPSPPEGGIFSPPFGGTGGPKPSAPRHNLPAQTTPFIGRERELAELTRRLTDPDTRLVTILGPGGMGKTRLARQAGRRLLERFADGVWFLSLAAVDATSFGPALNPLLNGLASLFGLRLHGGSSPHEQVLGYLQGRQMLLIFDDLEHLIDDSEVLSQLLSSATGMTVLTTSRERLNLQEEWLFPLAGLALTLDGPLVEDQPPSPPSNSPQRGEDWASPPLGGTEGGLSEAVQLFQQTAQRLQPGFDLHPNLNAVAQICRLVEGMPLGIELAASWVRYMSPAEIAREIEKDIDFLATTVRNLPPRHRSLRAVFDHSWRLLSPQEQAVLPRLAVFRGGFRPAEAQAVTGASRLVLTGLVDKSLIAVSAEGHYDLHEHLRQYLLEKLREDLADYQAAHDRHSQVYLALLQLDPVELTRQTTLQRLTADFDNIRAAWHWAIDHAHWSAIRRARRGIHFFCLHKSWFLEENAFYERALSQLKHWLAQPDVLPEAAINIAIETATETEMQLLLAALHCDYSEVQGRFVNDPTYQMMLDENLSILRAIGPTAYPELADVLSRVASRSLRRRVNGYEAHRRNAQEVLTLCQSLGNSYDHIFALQGLGAAALFAGQFASAVAYADQLSALAEPVDNPYGRFAALEMRGHIALAQGDYPQAEGYYGQAYQLAVSIDPAFPAVPFVLADLANIARLQGDYAQAAAYLQQTAEHTLGHGHRDGFRYFRHHKVLLAVGYLAETQGDLPAAQQAFAEIWQQDQGHSYFSPAALIGLGWVALQQEDWAAARRHFATALPLIEQLETAPQALEALAGVAYLQVQAGQLEQALTLIGLVYHHPSSFQESKDRLAGLEAELRAALPPEQVQAALARGQSCELWATIAAVRAELET